MIITSQLMWYMVLLCYSIQLKLIPHRHKKVMSVDLVSQRSFSYQNRDVIFEVFSFIQDRTRRLSTTSNLQIVTRKVLPWF